VGYVEVTCVCCEETFLAKNNHILPSHCKKTECQAFKRKKSIEWSDDRQTRSPTRRPSGWGFFAFIGALNGNSSRPPSRLVGAQLFLVLNVRHPPDPGRVEHPRRP